MTDRKDAADTSTCGCCKTVGDDTDHVNRPGQPALGYRIGTHGSFLRRMVQNLPLQETDNGSGHAIRPLEKLTTQENSDPAIALLDAFAVVADVLTFYQERIANECYLRTATERRSVLELARAISYELNPGAAAGTYLAFSVEDAKGAPAAVTVPEGTRVQSLPAPGKLPQTFETSGELVARPEWNELKVKTTTGHTLTSGSTEVYLKKVNPGLRPGDYLLFVGDERLHDPTNENWDVRQVTEVEEFPREAYTRVSWQEVLGWKRAGRTVMPAKNPKIHVFRQRASLFGYNAPDWSILSNEVKEPYLKAHNLSGKPEDYPTWPGFTLTGIYGKTMTDRMGTIFLDALYPGIFPETWCALAVPEYLELYRVRGVSDDSRTDFAQTAKTTRLTMEGENLIKVFNGKIREAVVFLRSEELEAAEKPDTSPVTGPVIVVEGTVPTLAEGKTLVISGLSSADGTPVSEPVTLATCEPGTSTTTLTCTGTFKNSYARDSVTIYGNVVTATHGETVREILGSGNAALANQQFALKKPPLTYLGADTPTGGKSTLSVRVDDLEWEETPALYGKDGLGENYTVRIDNDARATVIFGDGKEGARLTGGIENVRAVYRSGIGPDGEVAAGSLTILPVRPQGIRGVTNPVAATGAAAPEERDHARTNAPLKIRTFDRVVSLKDYEDYARAFTGIAKARADPVWSGEECLVLITVLGPGGKTIDRGTPENPGPLENLEKSIAAWQDPGHPVIVTSSAPGYFDVNVSVLCDTPRYTEASVHAGIQEALKEAFSFEKRAFGQDVSESGIMSTIQNVPGVIAARDLDFRKLSDCSSQNPRIQSLPFYRKDAVLYGRYLPAHRAVFDGTQVLGSELLLICPGTIRITGWGP